VRFKYIHTGTAIQGAVRVQSLKLIETVLTRGTRDSAAGAPGGALSVTRHVIVAVGLRLMSIIGIAGGSPETGVGSVAPSPSSAPLSSPTA